MARELTERIPNATYVWDAAGRADESFIKDARTRLRVRLGVARPILAGIELPDDLTVLSAFLELVATDEWPGSRTMTARRIGDRDVLRKLTWDNQPDVYSGSSPVSVTQAGTQQLWRFDVTDDFTDAANTGERIKGWRITSSEDAVRFFHGVQARRPANRPRLVLTVTKKPAAPTDLIPSRGFVSVAQPVVGWHSTLEFEAAQIQVDENDGGFASPLWDSGEFATVMSLQSLATRGFPGLANLDDRDWRVRVKNDAGWSPWSLPGRLARIDKPTINITSPGATTSDGTPPIGWTVTGGTQAAYRAILRDANGEELWDSRWVPGADTSAAPTKGLRKHADGGSVVVRVRDDVDREATSGAPDYAQDTQAFTLDLTGAAGGVAWFNVTPHPQAPWIDLLWGRSETPDYWRILANGERVAKIPGPDLIVGTNRYGWRDWTAAAHTERTYQVQAVVNDVVTSSTEVKATPTIKGIWLGDPTDLLDVLILGRDEVTAENVEQATTLYPVGGDAAITVRQGRFGLAGTVTGLLGNAYGRLGADEAARLEELAEHSARTLYLAWADKNIPVVLKNIQTPPRRVGTNPGRVMRAVSFDFTQDRTA